MRFVALSLARGFTRDRSLSFPQEVQKSLRSEIGMPGENQRFLCERVSATAHQIHFANRLCDFLRPSAENQNVTLYFDEPLIQIATHEVTQ